MKSILFTFSVGLLLVRNVSTEYSEFDYSNEYSPPGGPGNASLTQNVLHPLKFAAWYKDFAPQLISISSTVCGLSLKAYRGDSDARKTLGPVIDYCWTHADCILSTVSAHVSASFSGTSILLGLAPTTLSVLGPSVAEMALLSLHRPILSLLLSLGAPAVFPGRFLLWDDPLRANEPSTGAFIVSPFSNPWEILVSILQYTVALLCVGNIFHATYWIGIRSIVSWHCRSSFWPLLWVLLSLAIHITAVMSLRIALQQKNNHFIADKVHSAQQRKTQGLMSALRNEVTPSANRTWQVSDLYDVRLGPLSVALQYTGAFFAVCHLVFGTLLFSSLLFIGVRDAVELILRLIASATFCRIVLQFEVGGMIRVDDKRIYKGIVQAPLEEKAAREYENTVREVERLTMR